MIENGNENNGIGNAIETATASVRGNEIWIVEIARGSANCWSAERTGLAAQTPSNGTIETDLLWTIGRETNDLLVVPTRGFPAPRPRAPFLTLLHPLLLLFLPHRTESQTNNSNSNNSNLLPLPLPLPRPLLSPIKPANRLRPNLVVMLTDQNPCRPVQNRPKTCRLLSALLPRLLHKCPHLVP